MDGKWKIVKGVKGGGIRRIKEEEERREEKRGMEEKRRGEERIQGSEVR